MTPIGLLLLFFTLRANLAEGSYFFPRCKQVVFCSISCLCLLSSLFAFPNKKLPASFFPTSYPGLFGICGCVCSISLHLHTLLLSTALSLMMEEGPDIDPSQLEWPFVSVLRCCNLYKTHKDKAANKYYQVLYLVEWAPGNGPLYTWTTAKCMEGVVFTVQSHVIDWCVVEDDNCASSVPVHFWKYDGDWPLEAPIEDGEELEVGTYDWVAKMPPGSLQQMIAKTLGDSPTANQDNSEQVSDLFHPTALEGATSSSVTPTASQEHLDLVVVGDDEVQHENH